MATPEDLIPPAVPTEGLLSDQSAVQNEATTQLNDLTTQTQGLLSGVTAPDITYGGSDADVLKQDAGINSGSSYISPESTVSGQLNALMDSDNDYMRIQERKAKEQAANVGLLGSSAAVGATRRAAIESAMPIAQQDAKTYAEAALNEQKTYNEVSRMKAESDLSAIAREHVYDIDVAKGKLNATFQQISESAKMQGNMVLESAITEMKANWDTETKATLANLEADLNMKLKSQEISAREREYASTSSSQIMAAAYGTINDLLGNADFMAGYADNPEALTNTFNNFINLAKNQTEFIGATAGLGDEYFGDSGYGSLIGSWSTNMGGYTPAP